MRLLQRIASLVVLVCASYVAVCAQGYETNIRNISLQTLDLLTFRISVPPQHQYAARENVVITYTVRNDSRRMAYLVLEPQTRLVEMDEKFHAFTVASPVKYQEEWNRFDNTFVELRAGKSYSGKLVIDGTQIPLSGRVEWEDWRVQVRFAYVFNPAKKVIEELLECVDTTYSLPCLGALNEAASVLTIGTLLVQVLPPKN